MPTLKLTKTYSTYPEYKDSGVEWLGKIPQSWDLASSRRLFATAKERVGVNFSDYKILSLTLNGVIPRVLDGSGKNPAEYDTYQAFKKDDLVFCLFDYDVTPRTIGYVGEDGMMTGAYTRLMPKTDTYSKYFYYYFLSLDYTKELLHLCTGLRNSLSKPIFWSMNNPLPGLKLQKHIADYLDQKTALIDKTIEKKLRQIELLKEKRTAVINHAVTKGIDPNVELVESGIEWIGKIPKGWRIEKLKYIAPLVTKKVTKEDIFGTYVALENIESKTGRYIPSEESVEPESVVNTFAETDILFGKLRPYLAKVFVPNFSGTSTGEFLVMRPKYTKIRKYLFYRILSQEFINTVNDSTYGAQMPRANWSFIGNLLLTIPSEKEQEDIGIFLDKSMELFSETIQKIEKSIELLKEFKSSLISHVVTGKIKI